MKKVFLIIAVAFIASCTENQAPKVEAKVEPKQEVKEPAKFYQLTKEAQKAKVAGRIVDYIKLNSNDINVGNFTKAMDQDGMFQNFTYPNVISNEYPTNLSHIGMWGANTAKVEYWAKSAPYKKYAVMVGIKFNVDTITGDLSNGVSYIRYQKNPNAKEITDTLRNVKIEKYWK